MTNAQQHLLDHLNQVLSKEESFMNFLLAQSSLERSYKKGEALYKGGCIPDQLIFLVSGTAVTYLQVPPKRQLLRCWGSNDFLCPSNFFHHQALAQPIWALEHTTTASIPFDVLLEFLSNYPRGYKILNTLIRLEIACIERLIQNRLKDPFSSLEAFVEVLMKGED